MIATKPAFKAVILDLDGMIARTSLVHAWAWKRMFDEYRQVRVARGDGSFQPFHAIEDFQQYIEGKPRYDGVQGFLQSRGIELPGGDPSDDPASETICGLGNRKNQLFREVLAAGAVDFVPDALTSIRAWRARGLKTGVVSASRNCETVLDAAGLTGQFDACVDGVEAARLGLKGKPAPDTFLEAARRLGVEPASAVLVEDAVAGVQAGRTGEFGLVVGVDRAGIGGVLREHGASMVVRALHEVQIGTAPSTRDGIHLRDPRKLPSALAWQAEIARKLIGRPAAVFLDYDGTLTPIVAHPEDAVLSEDTRAVLSRLSQHFCVAIVSGRDRRDVEKLVNLRNVVYVGCHGFDISGPGLRFEHEAGMAALLELDYAESALRHRLRGIADARVERKRFSIAVHYRNVAQDDLGRVETLVDAVHREHRQLRKMGGKKVFELRPDVEWDKGTAVRWMLGTLRLESSEAVPVYLGDDLTDEDAFAAIAEQGISILVGEHGRLTRARYHLDDVKEVRLFLDNLAELRERETA